jgi:hypothetical protein
VKKAIQGVFLFVLAAQVLVVGQGAEASKVLAGLRAALGGEEKLAAVKTLAIEGQVTRSLQNGTSSSSDFEIAFELPDKYVKHDVFANVNGMSLKRRAGFNGSELIEETDMPPAMGGGGMHVMRLTPGGPMPGGTPSPEAIAAQRAQLLASSRREFARLALGLFGSSFAVFPVEFRYAGQAEAPDGKADVLEVQGPDGFAAKFYVDGKTRLPLMLSWMDKEPLRLTIGGGRGGNVQMFGAGGSAQDRERMQQEMAERMKEAEANRRTVEYRLFFADYKAFGDVKLPTRIQRMMDGVPTEEMSLDKVKVNGKIDAGKFKVVK